MNRPESYNKGGMVLFRDAVTKICSDPKILDIYEEFRPMVSRSWGCSVLSAVEDRIYGN
jgi:hypothetical protein